MRLELLRGYCASVSFMDQQIGKVLDALDEEGLRDSTVVLFFSDHGFALGERGAWGKRSLFENDARVPLIIADPRFPRGHGAHTPAFAELVDLFPTLTELAGVAPATALVPPLSGVSLAPVVRTGGRITGHRHSGAAADAARGHGGGGGGGGGGADVHADAAVLASFPRQRSITQFSRCPITASEYLTDISGVGPSMTDADKRKDYRCRAHHGAIAWECTWKGWLWDQVRLISFTS